MYYFLYNVLNILYQEIMTATMQSFNLDVWVNRHFARASHFSAHGVALGEAHGFLTIFIGKILYKIFGCIIYVFICIFSFGIIFKMYYTKKTRNISINDLVFTIY